MFYQLKARTRQEVLRDLFIVKQHVYMLKIEEKKRTFLSFIRTFFIQTI